MNLVKKILYIALLFSIGKTPLAQTRPTPPIKPDLSKLAKMSPAELEEYKKQMLKDLSASMKNTAAENHIQIDETLLPDYELQLPGRDASRLASIPAVAPSLPEL